MDKLERARIELHEMDEISAGDSMLHRVHPLCKLLVTVIYIAAVVSFHKYDVTGLIVMVLYPVIMFQAAQIPVFLCFYKLRVVLPFVCAAGLVNPFLDHTIVVQAGGVTITGGMMSMAVLMLKGCLALAASFLLMATTSIDSLCRALRMIHVPEILTTLLMLTYRYIGIMVEEASVMVQAYSLRAPHQTGIHITAWGSFLGQLWLRSMDRAEELYSSMLLRGFRGEFYYSRLPSYRVESIIFTAGSLIFIAFSRTIRITQMIGSLLVR